MNIQLTEKIIRDRANEQSYQKGCDYYRSGAIYSSSWQATPGGVVLMAQCEGSSAPFYRLRVELDAGGARTASCTCPYNRDGDISTPVPNISMLSQHGLPAPKNRASRLRPGF